jgi:DNA-binding transcriptional ArsR family regulator
LHKQIPYIHTIKNPRAITEFAVNHNPFICVYLYNTQHHIFQDAVKRSASMQKPDTEVMDQNVEPLVSLFRLLSDRTRLNILILLSNGERNVTSLCDNLALPQPTVSHHLGLLRGRNLIASRRNGKQVFYALNSCVNRTDGIGINILLDGFQLKIVETKSI